MSSGGVLCGGSNASSARSSGASTHPNDADDVSDIIVEVNHIHPYDVHSSSFAINGGGEGAGADVFFHGGGGGGGGFFRDSAGDRGFRGVPHDDGVDSRSTLNDGEGDSFSSKPLFCSASPPLFQMDFPVMAPEEDIVVDGGGDVDMEAEDHVFGGPAVHPFGGSCSAGVSSSLAPPPPGASPITAGGDSPPSPPMFFSAQSPPPSGWGTESDAGPLDASFAFQAPPQAPGSMMMWPFSPHADTGGRMWMDPSAGSGVTGSVLHSPFRSVSDIETSLSTMTLRHSPISGATSSSSVARDGSSAAANRISPVVSSSAARRPRSQSLNMPVRMVVPPFFKPPAGGATGGRESLRPAPHSASRASAPSHARGEERLEWASPCSPSLSSFSSHPLNAFHHHHPMTGSMPHRRDAHPHPMHPRHAVHRHRMHYSPAVANRGAGGSLAAAAAAAAASSAPAMAENLAMLSTTPTKKSQSEDLSSHGSRASSVPRVPSDGVLFGSVAPTAAAFSPRCRNRVSEELLLNGATRTDAPHRRRRRRRTRDGSAGGRSSANTTQRRSRSQTTIGLRPKHLLHHHHHGGGGSVRYKPSGEQQPVIMRSAATSNVGVSISSSGIPTLRAGALRKRQRQRRKRVHHSRRHSSRQHRGGDGVGGEGGAASPPSSSPSATALNSPRGSGGSGAPPLAMAEAHHHDDADASGGSGSLDESLSPSSQSLPTPSFTLTTAPSSEATTLAREHAAKKHARSSSSSSSRVPTPLSFPELDDVLLVLKKIGQGSFSSVYKASVRSPSYDGPKMVAVKRLNAGTHTARVWKEIQVLRKIGAQSPHVLPLIDAIKGPEDQVSLIVPYVRHDSFKRYYRDLSTFELRRYMHALFSALSGLHVENVIHRDVKPSNFLHHRASQTYMLIDFGLADEDYLHGGAKIFHPWDNSSLGIPPNRKKPPRAGTRGFRPPEVLMRSFQQTTAVDVWAAGVILLSILSCRYPFFHSPDDLTSLAEIACVLGTDALERVGLGLQRKVSFPEQRPPQDLEKLCAQLSSRPRHVQSAFPPDVYHLLARCLDPDPATRITAQDALSHSFFGERGARC